MFFRVVGRLTIRFLKRLGRVLIWPFKTFVRHPVGGIFSLLVIGGLVALGIFTTGFGIPNLLKSAEVSKLVTSPEPTVPPTAGSVTVLTGLAEYNAAKIWDGLNPDYRKQFETDGYNVAAMQKAIDDTLAGLDGSKGRPRYDQFQLNGLANTSGGGKIERYIGVAFYKNSEEPVQYIYQIRLDKDGKVLGISNLQGTDTDPVLAAAFKKAKTSSDEGPQSGQVTGNKRENAEKLMIGLTTFNADAIWNTLSPDYQKTLSTQKQKVDLNSMKKTIQDLQSQIQKSSQQVKYVGYVFQGTYEYPNKTSYTQYVANLQIGDQVREFQYGFLLDDKGQIIAITTNDSILGNMLGRQQQQ